MNYKCNLCTNLCEAGLLRSAPCDPISIKDKDNDEYNKINTKPNTEGPQLDLQYKANQEYNNVK